MEERLNVFLAELDAQWREILTLYSSIEKKTAQLRMDMKNEDLTDSLAYKLHNLYSAYEDMFKMVARFFENQIEDMSRYHADLLKRMCIEIKGIRPHFLSEDCFIMLDELRGFRHVFRHAYSYALDSERIINLSERSLKLKDAFAQDYTNFKDGITRSL